MGGGVGRGKMGGGRGGEGKVRVEGAGYRPVMTGYCGVQERRHQPFLHCSGLAERTVQIWADRDKGTQSCRDMQRNTTSKVRGKRKRDANKQNLVRHITSMHFRLDRGKQRQRNRDKQKLGGKRYTVP